jgi:enoyl-CoA hydratase/carnithine racemase
LNDRSFKDGAAAVPAMSVSAAPRLDRIALAIEGPIALATLCRPPVNAIDEPWIARLDEILDGLERAEGVSVLVLRSSERVFSAGADLELMRARIDSEAGRAGMVAFVRELQRCYARLERMEKVTIAAIGGAALGGGLELALACDLRVVAETATVGLPESRLGLIPGAGGTQRLTRLCGAAVARRLIFGAETVRGAEAAALGIAQWVVPAGELDPRVRAIAEQVAGLPAPALAASKRCIRAALEPEGDGYGLEVTATGALLAAAETQERIRGFLEGRR